MAMTFSLAVRSGPGRWPAATRSASEILRGRGEPEEAERPLDEDHFEEPILELERQIEVRVTRIGSEVPVLLVGAALADEFSILDVPELGAVDGPAIEVAAVEDLGNNASSTSNAMPARAGGQTG